MEKNSWIIDDYENLEVQKRKTENGDEIITSSSPKPAISKSKNESNLDFLKRSVCYYLENSKRLFAGQRISFSTVSDLFSDATASLYEQNMAISGTLGNQFLGSRPLDIPLVSPVDETSTFGTNQRLNNVVSQLGKLLVLIKNMNDLGRQMATDAQINSNRERKHNRKAIRIGVISIVVTMIFSIMNYVSSCQSNNRLDRYLNNLHSQMESSSDLIQSQEKEIRALKEATSSIQEAQIQQESRLKNLEVTADSSSSQVN